MNINEINNRIKQRGIYTSLKNNNTIFGGLAVEKNTTLKIDIVQKPFWVSINNKNVIELRYLNAQVNEYKIFNDIVALIQFLEVDYPLI